MNRPPVPCWLSHPAWLSVPILISVLLYSTVLDGEFLFDDRNTVVYATRAPGLERFVTPLGLLGSRPVTDITFAWNYQWGQGSVRPYHATNILLHALTTIAVFLLVREVFRRARWPESDGLWLFIAGVFALHPIQSGAVNYIAQRAEILASLFYVVSVLALLQADRRGVSGSGFAWGSGAILAFVVGLGAKPICVTVPIAFLAICGFLTGADEGGRLSRLWRWRLFLAGPLLVVSAGMGFLFTQAVGHDVRLGAAPEGGVAGPAPLQYFATQLSVVVTYLRLLVWPTGQNIDHDYPIAHGLDAPTMMSGALLALILGGAVTFHLWVRYQPGLKDLKSVAAVVATGLIWFFIVLSPTSSIIPVADVIFEHRVYLPSVGIFMALAAGGYWLVSRFASGRQWVLVALTVAIWSAAAVALHVRNPVWQTQLALWQDAFTKSPQKTRVKINYGQALMDIGRYEEALRVLEPALEAAPKDPALLNNLAICYLERKDLGLAESFAARAVQAAPDLWETHNTLGEVRFAQGNMSGAFEQFKIAFSLNSVDPVRAFRYAITAERVGLTADACAGWSAYSQQTSGAERAKGAGRLIALGCAAHR